MKQQPDVQQRSEVTEPQQEDEDEEEDRFGPGTHSHQHGTSIQLLHFILLQ